MRVSTARTEVEDEGEAEADIPGQVEGEEDGVMEDSPADAPPTEEAGSQKTATAPLKEDWFSFDS